MTFTPRYYTVLTLAIFLAACGDSSDPGSGNSNGGIGDPVATNNVSVADNSFTPQVITLTPGATVTWTWAGSNDHNVTFDDGVDDSVTQDSGSHTRTFGAAGTFLYHCTIHGASIMAGEVNVTTP